MKKISILLGLLFVLASTGAIQAAPKTLNLEIRGMTCGMCATKVENALKKVDGVSKATVDHKASKGSVEFDDAKAKDDQILEACNKTGFKCSVVP